MSRFASRENTLAEQHAILHELETLLDARLVEEERGSEVAGWPPRTGPVEVGGGAHRTVEDPAKRASSSTNLESPARPNWDQPMLFEGAA